MTKEQDEVNDRDFDTDWTASKSLNDLESIPV